MLPTILRPIALRAENVGFRFPILQRVKASAGRLTDCGLPDTVSSKARQGTHHFGGRSIMNNARAVVAATLFSAVWCIPAAIAQPLCVTQNFVVPPGANDKDKAAPFFIDTTGLDFSTQPPTRDPKSPHYVKKTELPDGTLPPAGAEGNFPTARPHNPHPRRWPGTACQRAPPSPSTCRGKTVSSTTPDSSVTTRLQAAATAPSCARRLPPATSPT